MRIYDNETLKAKIKRRKTIGKIIALCLWILLAFIVVCVCIAFCQRVVMKEKYVSLFGFSSFAVVSGSMQPSIDVNDVIVVRQTSESDLEVDDIIAFFDADGNIITHRIVGITPNDGKTFYITKGDNNTANDSEPIPYENVIGKYSFGFPGGAYFVAAITSPFGMIPIILAVVIIGLTIILKINRKSARHSIREKYKKQSVDKEKKTNE